MSKRGWNIDLFQHPGGTETIPLIASSSTLAAAFISCLVMIIGMPLGRRNCIIIGNVLITIGGIIQAASYSVPQIIVARVLCVCATSNEKFSYHFQIESLINGMLILTPGRRNCSMMIDPRVHPLRFRALTLSVYHL